MSKIIVTCPHCYCIDLNKRDCDRKAPEAFKMLKAYLSTNKISYDSVESTQLRSVCDNNRKWCHDTIFHKLLDKLLKEYRYRLCVDVHSFPDEYNPKADFYVIVNFYDVLTVNLLNDVKKVLSFGVYDGSSEFSPSPIMNTNYIIDKMHTQNIPAFIIEFNESLNKNKLEKIMQVFVNSIKKYV